MSHDSSTRSLFSTHICSSLRNSISAKDRNFIVLSHRIVSRLHKFAKGSGSIGTFSLISVLHESFGGGLRFELYEIQGAIITTTCCFMSLYAVLLLCINLLCKEFLLTVNFMNASLGRITPNLKP